MKLANNFETPCLRKLSGEHGAIYQVALRMMDSSLIIRFFGYLFIVCLFGYWFIDLSIHLLIHLFTYWPKSMIYNWAYNIYIAWYANTFIM